MASLTTDMKEAEERVVAINDFTYDIVLELMRYLHTGQADIDEVTISSFMM
jgi:hypothetical protein